MKQKHTKEVFISTVLILLLIFLLNPFDIFMPSMVQLTTAGLVVVCFGIVAGFMLKEDKADEREEVLRSVAGRNAFLLGAVIGILGITYQTLNHILDPWLPAVLVSMILAKLFTRIRLD